VKPFQEIAARDIDLINLREEIDAYGYVMIRSLPISNHLTSLLSDITTILHDAAWLAPQSTPTDRIANPSVACADGEKPYKPVSERVFNLQSFHQLPHHPLIQHIMKRVVGPNLLIHPKSAARLIFPNFESATIHAHQDHTSVGGDDDSYTAWMPLHNCGLEDGPLRILEGSHKFGLQPTDHDGYVLEGNEHGCEWAGGEISAGDMVIFHSLTIHAAAPNRSSRLRISLDCRFQSYDRPINPGTLVFTGTSTRSWEDVYTKWTSEELKYYWTRLPLKFKPSKQELAALAQTCEAEPMRARYARILERIDSQMPMTL
jgi:ectoine hydroxylase-related dioxygenase (phytanoyl-CoA dioxygenase family)